MTATKQSNIIFMEGKEKVLEKGLPWEKLN